MLTLALVLAACDADCDDPARINGDYAALHTLLNVSGTAADGADTGDTAEADAKAEAVASGYDEVSYALFANGWSHWSLTRVTATGEVNISMIDARERMGDPGTVDGQTFSWTGALTEAADNCNAYDLAMQGQFTTSAGTIHNFQYTSALTWQGTGLAGTFTYADAFTHADGSEGGSIDGATGEVVLVLQAGDTFDTGF